MFHRYFRALANGDIPPVKERLELATATQRTDTGLTPGLLRVLHRQAMTIKLLLCKLDCIHLG